VRGRSIPRATGSSTKTEVANVFDNRKDTSWQTEGYTNGLGKPGVGLWVHTARDVPATKLTLRTDLEGWPYTVYGSDQPSPNLKAWTRVSGPAHAMNGKPVALDTHGRKYGYWMVWVTGLSVEIQDSSKSRARIQELHILAPADA